MPTVEEVAKNKYFKSKDTGDIILTYTGSINNSYGQTSIYCRVVNNPNGDGIGSIISVSLNNIII